MRAGVIISVVSHIVLVALALLGTPKLFDFPTIASIEVDLVRPEEVETAQEKPKNDEPAPWNALPEKAEPRPEAPAQAQAKRSDVSQQTALGPQTPAPTSIPQARPAPS